MCEKIYKKIFCKKITKIEKLLDKIYNYMAVRISISYSKIDRMPLGPIPSIYYLYFNVQGINQIIITTNVSGTESIVLGPGPMRSKRDRASNSI